MWPNILDTVITTVSDITFPRIGGSRLRRSSTVSGDTLTTTGGLQLWPNDQFAPSLGVADRDPSGFSGPIPTPIFAAGLQGLFSDQAGGVLPNSTAGQDSGERASRCSRDRSIESRWLGSRFGGQIANFLFG